MQIFILAQISGMSGWSINELQVFLGSQFSYEQLKCIFSVSTLISAHTCTHPEAHAPECLHAQYMFWLVHDGTQTMLVYYGTPWKKRS